MTDHDEQHCAQCERLQELLDSTGRDAAALQEARAKLATYEARLNKARQDIYNMYSEIAAINNTAHCGICKYKLDGLQTLTFVNEGFMQLFGYSWKELGEALHYHGIELVADERVRKWARALGQAHNQVGDSYSDEFWMRRKDGERIWVHTSATVSSDAQGELYMFSVIQDITPLKNTEMEMEMLAANIPGGIAIYELREQLTLSYANDGYYRLFGHHREQCSNGNAQEFLRRHISQDTFDQFQVLLQESVRTEQPFAYQFRVSRLDGELRWCEINARPYMVRGGVQLFYAVLVDITQRKELERKLSARNEQYNLVASSTNEVLFTYDLETDSFIYPKRVGPSDFQDERIGNFIREEYPRQFVHPEDYPRYREQWRRALELCEDGSVEYRTRFFDPDYRWYRSFLVVLRDERGQIFQVVGRSINIDAEQQERAKNRALIDTLSSTDPVTGLLNLQTFERRAGQLIFDVQAQTCCAVIYCDINDFSYINENFGYEAGNKVLRIYGDLMRQFNLADISCRMHSDYFVAMYIGDSRQKIDDVVRQLGEAFEARVKQKYPLSDIHLSIGVFFVEQRDCDISTAIDNANIARKAAKNTKNIPYGVYNDEMRLSRLQEQLIAARFAPALAAHEFEMFLQPKFSLRHKRAVGAEALARWRKPEGGYFLPGEFIPILEKVGYIVALDFYIYEQALKALSRWQQQGHTPLPLSVNFSRLHAADSDFVDKICSKADDYRVPHALVEVEATESALIGNTGRLLDQLMQLRQLGFVVDMDDFGTGYSSLNLLMSDAFDIIKVDKSLLQNMHTQQDRQYIQHLVTLIRNTDKEVIFEGVETEAQVQLLLQAGCATGQGWVFDRALPLEAFETKYIRCDVP